MNKPKKSWDVFCKIVDNFGDIGVCWRLVRQLHHEFDISIRFYVDNLPVASKILTGIGNESEQEYEGVTIVRWDDSTSFENAADVVIETFACDLPLSYQQLMTKETLWVNVDYLSAEPWVPEFHGLNGKQQNNQLVRHFFFPGFTNQTGGLIREQDLIARRDTFQQSDDLQHAFWQPFAIDVHHDDLKISLFSYTNAPIEPFLQTLAEGDRAVSVFMPMNSCLPTSLLGIDDFAVDDCVTIGALTLHVLPFLSQEDYDKLLWSCDINFVRGEDSWVRAAWAGKPFIWQPYWQTDNAHLVKLNAFLATFYDSPEHEQTLKKLHESWSVETFHHDVWQHYIANLPAISAHSKQQSDQLIQQDALAGKLVAFCANLMK